MDYNSIHQALDHLHAEFKCRILVREGIGVGERGEERRGEERGGEERRGERGMVIKREGRLREGGEKLILIFPTVSSFFFSSSSFCK